MSWVQCPTPGCPNTKCSKSKMCFDCRYPNAKCDDPNHVTAKRCKTCNRRRELAKRATCPTPGCERKIHHAATQCILCRYPDRKMRGGKKCACGRWRNRDSKQCIICSHLKKLCPCGEPKRASEPMCPECMPVFNAIVSGEFYKEQNDVVQQPVRSAEHQQEAHRPNRQAAG